MTSDASSDIGSPDGPREGQVDLRDVIGEMEKAC